MWVDTHCHLDAFQGALSDCTSNAVDVRQHALEKGVHSCVYPAVEVANFESVRALAHAPIASPACDGYALGIHPLYIKQANAADLHVLDATLQRDQNDPKLLAVGEIGLDFFVPRLCTPELKAKQIHFYTAQLKLAQKYHLPVILHVRKSADQLLKALRELRTQNSTLIGGIAHAFNGSLQQAEQFIELGFKLGFGGASTYNRANNLHKLLKNLPLEAIVLETDAPDMPPSWLYTSAERRRAGMKQAPNTPAQLPAIGEHIAAIMGLPPEQLAARTTQNARDALTKLAT